jgi:hypothetical protein
MKNNVVYLIVWLIWFASTLTWVISFGTNGNLVPMSEAVYFLIAFVSSVILNLYNFPYKKKKP